MSKVEGNFTLWENLLSDDHALQKAVNDLGVREEALTYDAISRMIPNFDKLSSEERQAIMVSIVAQFRELRPANPIERMLVTQIIGLHMQAIDCLQSANGRNAVFEMRDTQLKQAMNLMDHCLMVVNAFQTLRAKDTSTENREVPHVEHRKRTPTHGDGHSVVDANVDREVPSVQHRNRAPVRGGGNSIVDVLNAESDNAGHNNGTSEFDIDFDQELQSLMNRNEG